MLDILQGLMRDGWDGSSASHWWITVVIGAVLCIVALVTPPRAWWRQIGGIVGAFITFFVTSIMLNEIYFRTERLKEPLDLHGIPSAEAQGVLEYVQSQERAITLLSIGLALFVVCVIVVLMRVLRTLDKLNTLHYYIQRAGMYIAMSLLVIVMILPAIYTLHIQPRLVWSGVGLAATLSLFLPCLGLRAKTTDDPAAIQPEADGL